MNSKIAVVGRGKEGIKRYRHDNQKAANTNADSKYDNTESVKNSNNKSYESN